MPNALPPTGNVATDTANLQAILDSYDYVAIHDGVYTHSGLTITRSHQVIDCAGSNLIPANINAAIVINAPMVQLKSLRIETTVAVTRLVYVQQSQCLLDAPDIIAPNALVGIEVNNSTGFRISNGAVKGNSGTKTPGSIGILIGLTGGYEFEFDGAIVHHWERGVVFRQEVSVQSPIFKGGSIEACPQGCIHFEPTITTGIYGLNIFGTHFEGIAANYAYVKFNNFCSVQGMTWQGSQLQAVANANLLVSDAPSFIAAVIFGLYARLFSGTGTAFVVNGISVQDFVMLCNQLEGWTTKVGGGRAADVKQVGFQSLMVAAA